MPRSKSSATTRSQLRIIGGKWRGRKLGFNAAPGLRPTPDRVRETLFNWLAADISGARCLDLFAGSGALGLEALSRGAQHCTFVDTSREAINTIAAQLQTLEAEDRSTYSALAAQEYLGSEKGSFDIVFLDPPYHSGLVHASTQLLDTFKRLTQDALVYIETHTTEETPVVPAQWQLHREKQAGEVAYRLYHTRAG